MVKKTKKVSVENTPMYRSFARANIKWLILVIICGFVVGLTYQKFSNKQSDTVPKLENTQQ